MKKLLILLICILSSISFTEGNLRVEYSNDTKKSVDEFKEQIMNNIDDIKLEIKEFKDSLKSIQETKHTKEYDYSLTFEKAEKIAHYVFEESKKINESVSIVIMDKNSDILLVYKSDLANSQNSDIARNKAFTSLRFQLSTSDVEKRINEFPNITKISKIYLGYGGVPLKLNGEVVGAIGIDGANIDYNNEILAYKALEMLDNSKGFE